MELWPSVRPMGEGRAQRPKEEPVSLIIVSCRMNFTSDQKHGDDLLVREYPQPSDDTTFRSLDLDELSALVDGRHAAILVHGFRNPMRNVLAAYGSIQRDLKAKGLLDESDDHPVANYGRVIGFVWPGFRTRLIGFLAARPSANRSGELLRQLLSRLRRSARSLDVQTHSLGARVALQALATGDDLWVDNLMMTAPAVDNECLEPEEEFSVSLDNCRRALVYHSSSDAALKKYSIIAVDKALGAKGPAHPKVIETQCPNVYTVDCAAVVRSDHGGYRKAPKYFDHWGRVLAGEPLPRVDKL
jgi:esterase/lipase superfamily enzyme